MSSQEELWETKIYQILSKEKENRDKNNVLKVKYYQTQYMTKFYKIDMIKNQLTKVVVLYRLTLKEG